MKKNKGFTLIELLAVIVILGILLSISIVAVNRIRKKQNVENKLNVLNSIFTGAKNYIADNPNFWNQTGCNNNGWNTGTPHCDVSGNITGYALSVNDVYDYVDFDVTKYPEWNNRSMFVKRCGNTMKYEIGMYYATYNADNVNDPYIYNDKYALTDCGCEEQAQGDNSYKFCDANHPGNGWDVNGTYFNKGGYPTSEIPGNLEFDK